MLQRSPNLLLQPYVQTVWASSRPPTRRGDHEFTFPGVCPYVVIRLDGTSLRLKGNDGTSRSVGEAVVSGIQMQAFERELNCTAAVGAALKPGTLPLLTNNNSTEFTNRHLPLDLIWNARETALLIEHLAATVELETRLQIFEDFLLTTLSSKFKPHPVIADALQRLGRETLISELAQSSGFSHRHFNHLFTLSVGVSPKHYQRLLRVNFGLSSFNAEPARKWSDVAADAGYADQSHFSREFRALCGMTPTEYAQGTRRNSLHLVR